MRIAIVGSGISGLACAHLLHPDHDVVLYEGGDHLGGHTHTQDVEVGGVRVAVDTGFIVYNETTYPELTRLLATLGVATRPSEMSFSVRDARTGLEWCGSRLDGLFAQRANLLSPRFHRMLLDVVRFNAAARELAASAPTDLTLGEFVRSLGLSDGFRDGYLVPIGTAIWSADPARFEDFPAHAFARFFDNHRLLQLSGQPEWRTVAGGARRYVEAIARPLADRVRRTEVHEVRRLAGGGGVLVAAAAGRDRFDRVVLATHSDQALALLSDADAAERDVLSAIPYQRNVALLHTDASVMPRARRAWASWNALVPEAPRPGATLTYDMNRLQGLATPAPLLVSLNLEDRIAPEKVLRRMVYHHPVFTPEAIRAQARHAEIDGARRVHFAGAYWGHGFHEDGLKSALRVVARIGAAARRAA